MKFPSAQVTKLSGKVLGGYLANLTKFTLYLGKVNRSHVSF